jgi:hypothetical protein
MTQIDIERYEEHLPYEISMLRGTYSAIARIPGATSTQLVENALIESFCIHARALFEFFAKESARHTYTNATYRDLGAHDKFRDILNNQIAHVIFSKRKTKIDQKINSQLRFNMYDHARLEIENFRGELLSKYDRTILPELPVYLSVPTMNSATNAIQMSTVAVNFDPTIANSETFVLSVPETPNISIKPR